MLGGLEGLSFVKTKHVNYSEDFPDIEFHFTSGSPSSDGGKQFWKVQNLNERVGGRGFDGMRAHTTSMGVHRWVFTGAGDTRPKSQRPRMIRLPPDARASRVRLFQGEDT